MILQKEIFLDYCIKRCIGYANTCWINANEVHTLYISSLYSIFRLVWIYKEEQRLRSVVLLCCYLCVGFMVAFALTAFQIFPTVELSSQSMRPTKGLSLQQVDPLSCFLTPKVILKEILNSSLSPGQARWGYIGIIPIILSILSLINRQHRHLSCFFFGSGMLFLFLSFGTNTPLFKLYHSLPTGDCFRFPTRFLYLFAFSFLSGLDG